MSGKAPYKPQPVQWYTCASVACRTENGPMLPALFRWLPKRHVGAHGVMTPDWYCEWCLENAGVDHSKMKRLDDFLT